MRGLFFLYLLFSLSFTWAQEIKFLSYNVFLRPGAIGWADYKPERFAELVDAVKAYDVIGLSEVFDDARREEWRDRLRQTHPYWVTPPESGNPLLQDGGLVLFSRYPIVFSRKMIYKDSADWDAMSEKGALFARIQLPSEKLFEVVLTHTQAEAQHFPIRKKQFSQLQKFILKNHQAEPLFVMGDMNVIGHLEDQYQDMLERLEYPLDAFRALSKSPGYTWDGPENPLAGGKNKERLDYIFFHDRQKSVTHFECQVRKFPMKKPFEKALYMSDHYAIEAKISLGEKIFSPNYQDIQVTAPQGKPLTIRLQDEEGKIHQKNFPSGLPAQGHLFPQIKSGRILAQLHHKNRLQEKFVENGQVSFSLAPETSKLNYTHPTQWPVAKILLSGEFLWEKEVHPGENTTLDIPPGEYYLSLSLKKSYWRKAISVSEEQTIDASTLLFSAFPSSFSLTDGEWVLEEEEGER